MTDKDKEYFKMLKERDTAKPCIKTQPADRKVAAKKTATFKVTATGRGLHYQWYRLKPGGKWVKISGATSATYKVTAKKALNGYKFRCKVTNVMGSVTSKAVKLTVK